MVEICASLLAANHGHLARDLKIAERQGITRFHLDVCDGHYTDNIIFGDQLIKDLRNETDSVLEVHLAVLNIPGIARRFMDSGADIISLQFETTGIPTGLIKEIKRAGISAGLTVLPATGLSQFEYYLEDIDYINVLAVDPGSGGQQLSSRVLRKIEKTAAFIQRERLSTKISIDGGVNMTTLASILDSGVDIITIGTGIFQGDISSNISEIFKQISN